MALICSSCGQVLAPTDKFCSGCGSPQPRSCVECGAVLPGTAKFCSQCGSAVQAEPPTIPVEAPLPTLPPGLREKFESVRDELQGDRREVVVVFADLSGYTAMSERMDPEEVTLLISRVLHSLAAAVYDFEGYVDKFIGDAVMALFGAPLAHENDPERAVLASLAMQEVIERYNRTAEMPIALRVGINVGEVVAAHLGSAGRLQYTVLGDAVNIAARLEGQAERGGVLVSEAVYERLSGRFVAEEVPPLELKGKSRPIRAWHVREYRGPAAAERAEATPFVGRDRELAALDRFFRGIGEGHARTLLIEAEPGGGKSRLVREALARFDEPLLTIPLSLSPIRLPGQRPPAVELFTAVLPSPESSPVESALAILGAESERHRSGILALAGMIDLQEKDASPIADAAAARQNRWVALSALLQAASRDRSVVLWVEDIHWAGEEAAELLAFLLSSTSGARVGFLLTARPGTQIPWLPSETERMHLEPLAETAALALLGDLSKDIDVEQRRELIRRSQGNPMFIEELARALRTTGEQGLAAVPSTLQGLIKSRIDRLAAPPRTLLGMAAVLGGRFPGPLLNHMYALERLPMPFDASLTTLEEEGFLDLPGATDGECYFHHALMQEVAYGSLLLRLRKVLHESAARIGEAYYADRRETEAGFFAHHYWYAGLEDEAAPHLWLAGRSAADGFDLQLAEKYLSRAAKVVDEKPSILSSAEQRAELEERLGTVLLNRGRLDEADDRFRRLQSMGEQEYHEGWSARGFELQGRSAWYRGQLEQAQELFERGLACLTAEGGRVPADLHNALGIVHYYRGRAEQAFAEHSTALELRRQIDDRLGMAKSFVNVGNLLVDFRDDLDSAEDHYRRALEIAESIGDRQLVCTTLNNIGTVMQDRGDWNEAIETFQRAEELLEEMGWAHARYVNLQNQAVCEISLGRIGAALAHLDECLRRGDPILEPVNRVNTRCFLFDAYLRALDDEKAEQMLAEARQLQEEQSVHEAEKGVLIRLGRWKVARGHWSEAAEAFGRAAAAARREEHPAYAVLVEAQLRRAIAQVDGSEIGAAPDPPRGRPPMSALLGFLDAEVMAARDPARAADELRRVADLAAELGEVALERAACERQANLLTSLGDAAGAREFEQRAVRAMESLAGELPDDRLRETFLRHPRNAGLLAMAG